MTIDDTRLEWYRLWLMDLGGFGVGRISPREGLVSGGSTLLQNYRFIMSLWSCWIFRGRLMLL